MSANAGYATLTILPSAKGFASALQGEVGPGMSKAGDDGGKKSGGAFAGAFKGLVGPALALVSGAAIAGFVKDSILAAGELEQSTGAIETVFKGGSAQMLEWSKAAATSVGLTSHEFNELGTLIGSQLKNGGMAMDELGPKTNELIGLGADLSSMFGGTTKEAVEALSSALKGETDPIEKYGVSLSAAKVEAKAAELGFSKVGGELSNQAKQAATLALIMDQTKDAQGNFNREQDTFSHKMQVSSALWGDISTKIGTLFLPAATAVAGLVSDKLLPGFNRFMDTLLAFKGGALTQDLVKTLGLDPSQGFGAALAEGIGAARAFFAALRDPSAGVTSDGLAGTFEVAALRIRSVLDGIGQFFSQFALGLSLSADNPFLGMTSGVTQFGAKVRVVFDEVLGAGRAFWAALMSGGDDVTSSGFAGAMEGLGLAMRNTFDSLLPVIRDAFATLGPSFAGLVPLVIQTVQAFSPLGLVLQVLPQILPTVASALATIIPIVGQVLGQIVPLGAELVQTLLPVFVELVTAVLPPVVGALAGVVAAVGPLVSILLSALVPTIQGLMPVVTTVFGVIADVVRSAMQIVQGIIEVVTGVISGDWSKVWSGIGNILDGAWRLITTIVTGALSILGSLIGAGLNFVASIWDAAWSGISGFFRGIWDGLGRAVSSGLESIWGFLRGLPGQIGGFFAGAGQWLWSAGQNIVQGLLDGVRSLAGTIGNFFLNLMPDWIREPFKAALGIRSPSRLFRGYGVNIGEGLVLGMDDMGDKVQRAADALAPSAPSFASPRVVAGGLAGTLAASHAAASASAPVTIHGNVYGDPEDVVEELERRRRQSTVTNGLRAVALGV